MQYSSLIMAFLAASTVTAVPLNINLGAYSPALVVGDGEISFGGAESAEALVNTLAGASAGTEAAAAKGITRAGTADGASVITPEATTPIAKKEKRDLAGFNAALNFAAGALNKGPEIELGTGEGGSGVGITVKPGKVAKRGESLPTVTLLKIRSLGNNAVARKARRAESTLPVREVSVEDIDSINLNLDGDVEFSIAEVKP